MEKKIDIKKILNIAKTVLVWLVVAVAGRNDDIYVNIRQHA